MPLSKALNQATMITNFIVVCLIYLGVLAFLSHKSHQREKTTSSYLLAGGNLGIFIGLFTTAATIFSAFTMIGMPDFFRQHGIGAWVFLAVSDAIMVFGLIRIGNLVRKKARSENFKGMAGLMAAVYRSRLAGYITFVGALIFLVPYISVQIRGISIFLGAAFPEALPSWGWSVIIVAVMVAYSELGGLRAIIYNDALQGVLLFIIIWIIGINCLAHFGNPVEMFAQVGQINEKLLSVPGPKGLFTVQFLLISAIAIFFLPFTQPQISTRVVIMKSPGSLQRMAVGLGIFALLVILPTLFMGMYGAVLYAEASTTEFIGHVLLYDQNATVAALGLIGLIAAAVSTSDSQIFALGAELRSLLPYKDQKALFITRIFIAIFAVIALIFSILSSEHLVLLARTSFAGTALMGPMILAGVLSKERPGNLLPILTLGALILFIGSRAALIPGKIGILNLELVLFIFLGFTFWWELRSMKLR